MGICEHRGKIVHKNPDRSLGERSSEFGDINCVRNEEMGDLNEWGLYRWINRGKKSS